MIPMHVNVSPHNRRIKDILQLSECGGALPQFVENMFTLVDKI